MALSDVEKRQKASYKPFLSKNNGTLSIIHAGNPSVWALELSAENGHKEFKKKLIILSGVVPRLLILTKVLTGPKKNTGSEELDFKKIFGISCFEGVQLGFRMPLTTHSSMSQDSVKTMDGSSGMADCLVRKMLKRFLLKVFQR